MEVDSHTLRSYPNPQQVFANLLDRGYSVHRNLSSGLECLSVLDRVVVKQQVDVCEVCIPCYINSNTYEVTDSGGDQSIFMAEEQNDCIATLLCGPARPFEMTISNNEGREVMHLIRPYRCGNSCCCCFSCCCFQKIEVYSPPNKLIGTVEQEIALCSPTFSIKDEQGNLVFNIEGSWPTFCTCCRMEFQVVSPKDGTKVGKISKIASGFLQETFTTADNFGLSFPVDLAVEMKALLLGACFLVDFMYYEKRSKKN